MTNISASIEASEGSFLVAPTAQPPVAQVIPTAEGKAPQGGPGQGLDANHRLSDANPAPRRKPTKTKVRADNRERLRLHRLRHRPVSVDEDTLAMIVEIGAVLAAEKGIPECPRTDVVAYAVELTWKAMRAPKPSPAPIETPALLVTEPIEVLASKHIEATPPSVAPILGNTTPSALSTRADPMAGAGFRAWVEDQTTMVVCFDGIDPRKEILKDLGFRRPPGSYDWYLTTDVFSIEPLWRSVLKFLGSPGPEAGRGLGAMYGSQPTVL